MAQASYSFLDVAALDGVRQRFAAGDALAILSADLTEVIWANGPGAALFGHAEIEAILGAEAPLGAAAKRQIAGIRGFPSVGRDRPLLVRITRGVSSRAVPMLASAVALPDGEQAILLAEPAASDKDVAARAILGFGGPGQFVAVVDAGGAVEASSPGFERLGLTNEALAAMAQAANAEGRIVKRMLDGRRGPLPAGLARLTAAKNLLVVIDERHDADEPQDETWSAEAGETRPEREIWYLGSEGPADARTRGPESDGAASEPAKPAQGAATITAELAAVAAETADSSEAPSPGAESEAPGEKPAVEHAAVPSEEEPLAETASDAAAEVSAPAEAPQRATGPVRFVWRTDAEGKFSQISPEFATAVGELAADIVGRRFHDVAEAFGLDLTGEVAGLLARRDTWSGRTVLWPVADTDLRIPVDLAALPVYDRNRTFEGFRGFGVARPGDAMSDPKATGIGLTRLPEAKAETERKPAPPEATSEAVDKPVVHTEKPQETNADIEGKTSADPFHGEKPALSVAPAPDRRSSDKVIRLAEHRTAANDRGSNGKNADTGSGGAAERSLSTGERIAFQQIGERLKKESGGGPEAPVTEADDAKKARAKGPPVTGVEASEAATPASVEGADIAPDEVGDEEIADLIALDGGDGSEAKAIEPEEAAQADEPARPRKAARPGMSLLDLAEWSEPARPAPETEETSKEAATGNREAQHGVAVEPDGEDASERPAALVEMDEAVAFDEGDASAIAVGEDAAERSTGDDMQSPALQDHAAAGDGDRDTVEAEKKRADAIAPVQDEPGLSILEKLPVPVLVHSGDVLHYANNEFFALTGYRSVGELAEAGGIGALFADPYEDEAEFEPREKADRQMRLKTRDGRIVPVDAFLQSTPWNRGKALVLVLSRAREGFGGQSPLIAELEARVAEMRSIIDTATDGVVLISRDGNIRSISRPAEALFGMDSDDVAGKPFATLFAIESQKAARDYLNGLTDHGVASVLNDGREVIGREAQGRFIPLFMTIGKLPGESGYCAVVRDITQWKRAEEELTQARATAERTSLHKTEFLARVSHEIRTPLNAIIGFSELMLDEKFGPVANDRYRDYLRDINRSGNHVLDLVNDLLDISKIEAGQQEMAYEAVSLNETLASTVALMQPQANRERVIIRSSFASRLPEVVADLRSVRQIALNVLSNAVRYTQAGGQVIVSTAYEAQGEVVMRVRDTGIGMTQAEIEQALKPFKQINSLKRTRGDGTGLGLPLTKAMVEANRARFSIFSTPGEGTMVEVAFPSTRVLAD